MDKEQKKKQISDSEGNKVINQDSNESTNQFNAGGNDSDYDGGHPEDVLNEEQKKEQQEYKTGKSYNSGGNDSDYDGGHPGDVETESKGRVDSKEEN